MVPLGTCSAPFILFIPKISHNNTSILIFLITKEKKSTHKILKSFFTWYIDLFEHVLEFATLNTFVFQVFKSTYTKMDGKRRSQKIILKKRKKERWKRRYWKPIWNIWWNPYQGLSKVTRKGKARDTFIVTDLL